jgi:hypothetical protein
MGFGAGFADDAAQGGGDTAAAGIAELVDDETLDPRLVALDLAGTTWDARVDELEAVLFAQADAERRVATLGSSLATARIELAVVRRALWSSHHAADDADAQISDHRQVLQARALALFIGHGEEEQLDELQSVDEATEGARHRQLAAEVDEHQLVLLADLEEARAALDVTITDLEGREVGLVASVASLEQGLGIAQADLQRANDALPGAVEAVRRARRTASVPGLDIPVVTFDAYLRAETTLAETHPDCRIAWWMIAGVGRVESRHGTIGGRSVTENGRPTRPIIGIALDGGPGVKAIVDTDGGALDGDTEWDRAVGPMQFIPETWEIRGRDGNGDGVADPHNLYDATLSAGRYLCALGGGLDDLENLREAYFGYNTSSAYVALVERHATRYAEVELPATEANGS